MENPQRILVGTRTACELAILLIWIVEALFLLALVVMAIVTALGGLESQLPDWSVFTLVMATCLAAFVSFACTAIAVASLASAVTNIDTRNFHAEQLQLVRQREKHDYRLPEKTRNQDVNDVMAFRPERVT